MALNKEKVKGCKYFGGSEFSKIGIYKIFKIVNLEDGRGDFAVTICSFGCF